MGTDCFAILKINDPIRYFTNVRNGKIPIPIYTFAEEAKK